MLFEDQITQICELAWPPVVITPSDSCSLSLKRCIQFPNKATEAQNHAGRYHPQGQSQEGSTRGASLAHSPAPPLPGCFTDSWMVVMTIMVSAAATRARCMVQRTSSHSPAERLPKARPGPQQCTGSLSEENAPPGGRVSLGADTTHAQTQPHGSLPEASMPTTGPTTWTCPKEAATIAFPGFSHMLLRTQRRGDPGGPKLSCGSLLE